MSAEPLGHVERYKGGQWSWSLENEGYSLVGDGQRWTEPQDGVWTILRIQAFVLRTRGNHCCGGADRLWLELESRRDPSGCVGRMEAEGAVADEEMCRRQGGLGQGWRSQWIGWMRVSSTPEVSSMAYGTRM